MRGNNRFGRENLYEKRASVGTRDCVFISHTKLDKPAAREVAELILGMGLDVYFDENDDDLQRADQDGDDIAVVACIEKGIAESTMLLGVITENTKDSWWVPYEIGSATGRAKPHAHLITKEVNSLPSYIRASKVLVNLEKLKEWIPIQATTGTTEHLLERIERATATIKSAAVTNFSRNRSIDELRFY